MHRACKWAKPSALGLWRKMEAKRSVRPIKRASVGPAGPPTPPVARGASGTVRSPERWSSAMPSGVIGLQPCRVGEAQTQTKMTSILAPSGTCKQMELAAVLGYILRNRPEEGDYYG